LRAEAIKKFFYGDATPFFALVGVGLASGNGLLTKDDELEGVCWEIREAVAGIQNKWTGDDVTKNITNEFGLDDLNIGPPIDKGCSAVVYSASLKNPDKLKPTIDNPQNISRPESRTYSPTQSNLHTLNAHITGSVDNLNLNYNQFDNGNTTPYYRDRFNSITTSHNYRNRFESISENDDIEIQSIVGSLESNSNDLNTTSQSEDSKENSPIPNVNSTIVEYPLALKMMFNYDIQSNAMHILRAMYRETVPARRRNQVAGEQWEKMLSNQIINLPAHPNIVLMFGVFCAQIPSLMNSHALYPMALPQRLNPGGYGRNMSLFLLMKRYNTSLKEYLYQNLMGTRTSVLLFAQLLEAVCHLYRYGVSHRDLKSDNILLELNDDQTPVLILSDFGCCLADKEKGLRLPYPSADIDKGGNPALMAPEIITKEPGTFSILNYTKSDLWTAGTIAYELFGLTNPFYCTIQQKGLRNTDYNETDLPELPDSVPFIIRKLVENILQKNPSNRLSPDTAANVVQLYLWAPSAWLKLNNKPTTTEILQWLLSLTTKILCEARLDIANSYKPSTSTTHTSSSGDPSPKETSSTVSFLNGGRRTYTEYLLISSFLVRARLNRIKKAINWIHDTLVDG
jgi:serine/threonine protein kinase